MSIHRPEEFTHEEARWLLAFLRDEGEKLTEELNKPRPFHERLLPMEREGMEREEKMIRGLMEKLQIIERRKRPFKDQLTFEIQRAEDNLSVLISCDPKFVISGVVNGYKVQERAAEILGVEFTNLHVTRLRKAEAVVKGARMDYAVWEVTVIEKVRGRRLKKLAANVDPEELKAMYRDLVDDPSNHNLTGN